MNVRDNDSFEPMTPLHAGDDGLEIPVRAGRNNMDIPPRAQVGGWKGRTLIGLGIIALIALGVWVAQLQQHLKSANDTLQEYQANMARLEDRLMITDESVSQTSTQTEDKLTTMDTEIRKLWDNVWKKTREQLDTHEVRLEKTEAALVELKKSLNTQAIAISAVDKKVGGVQATVARLAEQVEIANGNANTMQASMAALNIKLQQLGVGVTGAASDKELMTQRINELEGWVESINEYRRQMNQRMTELESKAAKSATGQ